MSNIWTLLKVQIVSFFGINKAIYGKSEKEKDRIIYLLIGGFLIFTVIGGYSSLISYGIGKAFKAVNITEALLAIMLSATTIIILFTTAIKANGLLFGCGDYNIIMSFPIKTNHIIISKVLTIYILNFILSCLIMIPAGVIYGNLENVSIIYYIILLLTLFAIPLIPIVIAVILGSIIAFIATRFKYKNLINTTLTFILIISIMGASFNINKIESNISSIGKVVYKIYPLSKLYVKGVCQQDILSLCIFIFLSIGLFLLFASILSLKFKDINSRLISKNIRGNYKIKDLKSSSPFKALYKKELKRYFSSTLYVTNTAIGVIFLIAFSIAVCVLSPEKLEEIFQIKDLLKMIKEYAPFIFSIFISISCTTNSSISLEGKNIWILKSLPIRVKTILLSKIAVNLTILMPSILISSMMIAIKLKMGIIESVFLFLMPAIFGVLISIIGITINLIFPNLEWTNEVTPIKQSVSSFISIMIGVIVSGVLIGIIFKIKTVDINLIAIAITILLILITFLMYKIMNKISERTFGKL